MRERQWIYFHMPSAKLIQNLEHFSSDGRFQWGELFQQHVGGTSPKIHFPAPSSLFKLFELCGADSAVPENKNKDSVSWPLCFVVKVAHYVVVNYDCTTNKLFTHCNRIRHNGIANEKTKQKLREVQQRCLLRLVHEQIQIRLLIPFFVLGMILWRFRVHCFRSTFQMSV